MLANRPGSFEKKGRARLDIAILSVAERPHASLDRGFGLPVVFLSGDSDLVVVALVGWERAKTRGPLLLVVVRLGRGRVAPSVALASAVIATGGIGHPGFHRGRRPNFNLSVRGSGWCVRDPPNRAKTGPSSAEELDFG